VTVETTTPVGAGRQGAGGMATSKMSPSADRTIRILNHLAARAEQSFTFSQLRRDLDMSSGTLHALLASLVTASYVRRNHESLTYSLGPALLALGAAARSGYRLADDLVPEMERLSRQLGLTCHASVAQGEEVVVIARSGPMEPFGRRVRVGERYPLMPPFGTAYLAWSDPGSIDAYLARSDPPLSRDDRERCRHALESVRQRGYAVSLNPSTRHRVGELIDGSDDWSGQELGALLSELAHEEYVLAEVAPGSTYDVVAMTAPVFGPDGSVLALLALANFPRPVSAESLPGLAARLREATVIPGAGTDAGGTVVDVHGVIE
jgi:DNA-binding IclR family transcriptional regulator